MYCGGRTCHVRVPTGARVSVRYHPRMDTPSLVLASASPRRRRLLSWLGVPFQAVATDTAEDLTSALRSVPPVLARSLAADKALAARAQARRESGAPGADTIVAFDTIVVLDREVLGKPVDRADATRMLRALSGRTHDVITGVALLAPGRTGPETFAVTTKVAMRELSDDAIAQWLSSEEPMGCAGAYNIERHLASVDDDECYQNVAGLPLCHLFERLGHVGVEGLTCPSQECDAALGRSCLLGPRACVTPGL
jgi:nucleoside triphosphate pyrophosphatase